MAYRAKALCALFLFAAPFVSGCATYDRIKSPPAESAPISLVYGNEGASGWNDLPIGVHRVPNTDVIIAGHSQGAGIGLAFGLVGVLAADAIGTANTAQAVANVENALRIDLRPEVKAATQKLLESGRYGSTFGKDGSGPSLVVDPYAILTFEDDTNVRPTVFLKVTLKNSANAVWETRYLAPAGKAFPITGEASLTADGGRLLHQLIGEETDRAVGFMLDDVANRYAREGDDRKIYFETHLPFVREKFGLVGSLLVDDGKVVAVAPKIADVNVFSGILVFDKSAMTYRPATKDDAVHVVDDSKASNK
jgi:hypothetical protein